jgi:hypothetical protein
MSLAITTDFELGAGVGLHGGDTYFRGKKKCKLKIRKKISNFGKIHKSLEARKLIFKNRFKRDFFSAQLTAKHMAIPYSRNCTGSPQQDIFLSTAQDITFRAYGITQETYEGGEAAANEPPQSTVCDALFAVFAMALRRFLMRRADRKYLTLPIKMLQ